MKRFVAIFSAALVLAAAEVPIAPLGVYTAAERRHWAFQPRKDPAPPTFSAAARQGLGEDADRRLHAGRTQESGTETRAGRRPRHADPPRHLRPHRPAAHARRDRRLRRRPVAERLGESGGPPAGLAALRRAVGPPLAGRGPLRRERRLRVRHAPPRRLALPRLRGAELQRRQALQRVRQRATGRRRDRREEPDAAWSPAASTASARCARTPATRTSPARTTKCSPR